MSVATKVPKCFVDSLEHDPHVLNALKLVPRPPDPWPAARRKVREAEFALLRATSLNLAEDASFKERQLRDLVERQGEAKVQGHAAIATELQGTIDRLTKMVETAKALVEAVPEEKMRLSIRREYIAHREELSHFRKTLNRRVENEGYVMTSEDAGTLLRLGEVVQADDAEQKREITERQALLAAADDAKTEARQVLIDAMLVQVQQQAREAAKVIGVKAALYRAYPNTTPPAFLHAYNRAVAAARAADALGDHNISPLDEFDKHLDDNGRELLGEFTEQWKRTALKVVAEG